VQKSENGKVVDIKWHPQDNQTLLSLHFPGILVGWNVVEGTKVELIHSILFYFHLKQNTFIVEIPL
jgi:hypothetical protein